MIDSKKLIFSLNNAFSAIASCVCDPEMPYVNYHYVEENDGEPMCCACGYYFKLERMLVAPQAHQMMSIPDEGWFDPRLYNPDNHTYQRPANKQPTPAKDVLKVKMSINL